MFSALTGDVNESESVDNKAEDEDVLCDLQSRHLNDVVSGMLFRDADTIVSVQQVDDAGMPNCRLTNQTLEQTCAFHATLSSSSFDAARGHIDTGTIPHACDVCHTILTDRETLMCTYTVERPYMSYVHTGICDIQQLHRTYTDTHE